MDRVIVYIDGFNLYFGLRAKGWRRYYWYDPERLAKNLLKPGQVLVGVKYFTARISEDPQDPGKRRRQAVFLEAVESLPNTTVYYGHYLAKTVTCRRCGATWTLPEEKMTDVNMAVALLQDAFRDRFDTALLISADSDLAPAVEAVLRLSPRKRVVVVAPPARQSKRLEAVATATFRLGRKRLKDSQFPDEYLKPDGYVLRRPQSWR